MTQRLHLVFGGELVNPQTNVFRDVSDIHIVGMFPDYQSAFQAWKGAAQRTVDDAHMRYYIAHIHRLRDEARAGSPTSAATSAMALGPVIMTEGLRRSGIDRKHECFAARRSDRARQSTTAPPAAD
ncbi:MAG: DUF4170 domain-containing protein [Tabrizicola sp.]|nr:DUF4170 domain-containing protein [Tabrizicola sp.]